jgi:hypothetical protein
LRTGCLSKKHWQTASRAGRLPIRQRPRRRELSHAEWQSEGLLLGDGGRRQRARGG